MNSHIIDEPKLPFSFFGSYSEHISAPRLMFLRTIFGITGEYSRAFLFDGFSFCIGSPISYKAIASLECEASTTVDAAGYPFLPYEICMRRYTYTCLDGTPDLRYNYNPCDCSVSRYIVVLKGEVDAKMHVFGDNTHQVNYAIGKFNTMLRFSKQFDFEASFDAYLNSFEKREVLLKTAEKLTNRKLAAEKVVNAFASILPERIESANAEFLEKNSKALSELASSKENLGRINSELNQINDQMRQSIHSVRKDLDTWQKLSIINSFTAD
jgi:hypothetical protein